MRKFTVEQFEVPSAAMLQVSSLICDHQLDHHIMDVDEQEGRITLELHYSKQDREVIHQIEDIIADNSEEGDDEDDDDDEE
jgi:ribosomal protein S8